MLEPPDPSIETIIACLRREWQVEAARVAFLPLGADENSAVYRVDAQDGAAWFLKMRSGVFDETAVTLPKHLSDRGIGQIIAPLPTITGQLCTALPPFTLILYPFVAGVDGYQRALTERQWRDFGAAMRRIHEAPLPDDLRRQIAAETFSPRWRDAVRGFLALVEQETYADPVARQVAALLKAQRLEIPDLVERAGRLGEALRAEPPPFVLCHSDLHAGNLLIDGDDTFYIVDWDAPILAPRERDLMYAGGGQMAGWRSPQDEEALFYGGYGGVPVDQAALAYYRYERIVEDIAVYCQQLLLSTEGGDEREQSLRYLASNFLPGGVLAIARAQGKTA